MMVQKKYNTKMGRITHSSGPVTPLSTIKYKFIELDLGNLILNYDIIHDALKVICNKNLKRPRNFGDIGSLGHIWHWQEFSKNREIS